MMKDIIIGDTERQVSAPRFSPFEGFRLPLSWPTLLWLTVLLASLSGCGGCWKGSSTNAQAKADAEKKQNEKDDEEDSELARLKKEKKKEPFEIRRVTLLPGDEESYVRAVKPGHWISATQEMKANHFDFGGELEAAVVDNKSRPIDLSGTPYRLSTTRPALLPKGQTKHLEMTFFVPHASGKQTRVKSELRGKNIGRVAYDSREFFNSMPPYQYYFAVLARDPQRYAFVKVLDTVRPPWDDENTFEPVIHYLVVMPKIDQRVPVPTHPLSWTSIAYVLWDDVEPSLFTPEQQGALIDWLHWGGQLIINGPSSLDSLRGSFLAPYLPVQDSHARQLNDDALQALNRRWSLPENGRTPVPLTATVPWSGLAFKMDPLGVSVDQTGGLLVERFLGRGRIVVSAFNISERDCINWRSFDSFFNACILRRPCRKYTEGFTDVKLCWFDKEYAKRPYDAGPISALRYFTRDLGRVINVAPEAGQQSDPWSVQTDLDPQVAPIARGGVASWNAQSDTANMARQLLRDAAGIAIPKARFVVLVLAAYLLVLVPLNWLFFHAIGRVEWAWGAAPIIAILCAVAVIKLAQLDIGFARSQTEIAVLEVQEEYPRAHLTRFTALYTSLSTTYALHFDDRSAVAQPFPVDPRTFQLVPGQARPTVTYRRHQDVRLDGLHISSNTTGMVHSEQMYDMGGSLSLSRSKGGTLQVRNGTELDISHALLVHKTVADSNVQLEYCDVGDLPAGTSKPIVYVSVTDTMPGDRVADSNATSSPNNNEMPSEMPSEMIDLKGLFELALSAESFHKGLASEETRLVGRIDQRLSGLRIEPKASQIRGTTMVVAHLKYGRRTAPRPDVNTRGDLTEVPRPDRFGVNTITDAKQKSLVFGLWSSVFGLHVAP